MSYWHRRKSAISVWIGQNVHLFLQEQLRAKRSYFFPSRVQQLNVKFSELEDVVSVCDPQTTLGEALVIRGALADPPVVQDNLRGTRCLGHSQFNPVPKVMWILCVGVACGPGHGPSAYSHTIPIGVTVVNVGQVIYSCCCQYSCTLDLPRWRCHWKYESGQRRC